MSYRQRLTYLSQAGFLPWESAEFAMRYSMDDIRHNAYFSRMVRWRRLYTANLRRTGKSQDDVVLSVLKVYQRKGWEVMGRPDPWKQLKSFRKQAIESGDYPIPIRKRSHHGKGVSNAMIAAQYHSDKPFRQGIKQKGHIQTTLDRITALNAKIASTLDIRAKSELIEQRNELWRSIS